MKINDRPVVVFLIPFASREIKSKWEIACAHLRQTLKSIQNSTNGSFRVAVAGHEAPDFDVRFDSRFYLLTVNQPIPSRENYPVDLKLDRLTKIAVAWAYAKSTCNPRYVMKLDADDFISSRLVDWLDNADGEGGYLLKHGWFWRPGARYLIHRTEYFDRVCGSCLIIRSDVADRAGPFLAEAEGMAFGPAGSSFAMRDHYSLVPGSGTTTLLLNDTHQRYAAQFSYLGYELHTFPFDGLIYRVSSDSMAGVTGDRAHKFSLRMCLGAIRRTRFITQKFKKEFMLG